MEKKTVAVTIMTFLILCFLMAVGTTLSAFRVSKQKVEVKEITILADDGILIKDKKGNSLTTLDVKSSGVGVRPATGDEDIETNIPTTVNDGVGTEGAYASFFLTSNGFWEIVLDSCHLTVGDENIENIRVAIMEEKNDPISGADIGAILARGEAVQNKQYVVVAWLDPETTKSIAGAKISIRLRVNAK